MISILTMGQCFSPRGSALVWHKSCEEKSRGQSTQPCCKISLWFEAESTRVEVGELKS